MPSISSAGTARAAAACAHFGSASAAAPATALCRNNRRPLAVSFSAAPALFSFRRSKSDALPMIASSYPEFLVQTSDKAVSDSTVGFIRLFGCFRQPQPQDFFGLGLNLAKLHAHAHERV